MGWRVSAHSVGDGVMVVMGGYGSVGGDGWDGEQKVLFCCCLGGKMVAKLRRDEQRDVSFTTTTRRKFTILSQGP